ncbi:MAG TPA: KpsF/GutQ family sugar-phosphate isomerase [Desulfobulbaceae bacterium]|nr:KpsF/GutQ family sugar-phosphate isomerase [Desulfobulbaceae bacterium]
MSVELAREVLQVEADGILSVRQQLGEEFLRAVGLIMACPSRVIVTGIGKSGLVGQKITATLNSTGTPSFFLHPVEAMHGDLGMVAATDVVLAISYSGETTELNALLASISERKVSIIAMTGGTNSTLAACADVTLNVAVPKEACPLGLAPTTSTTATLALGDALAVALLERKQFKAEDFRRNHPGGSLGERLKVSVSEVMLTDEDIPSVSDDGSLQQAIARLHEKNLGAVMVTGPTGHLKGILTDGDVRRILINGYLPDARLTEVMTRDPVSISDNLLAADALSLMQRHEITILAVVDGEKKLQGILHLHDLLGKGEFRFLI